MSSAERQQLIIDTLKASTQPITGTEFAKKTNVSRQVIVQDVSILKAKNEPIIATSQGYLYLNQDSDNQLKQKVIVCKHTPEQTRKELNIIVDYGVSVRDVIVEHAVYGDLTASLHVSNRKEVDQFIKRIQNTNARYLLTLAEGLHLHTLEADSLEKIDAACRDLEKAGILVPE
ncbi:transcription repressor NadR [Salinibacillus xinjiangensis]|nr:transcription repressor NadR [Salinibacillus xinjiangensis]